jgi:hypothetical protein
VAAMAAVTKGYGLNYAWVSGLLRCVGTAGTGDPLTSSHNSGVAGCRLTALSGQLSRLNNRSASVTVG